MNIWLVFAGISAALTALVHTFVGGKLVARPLLAAPKFDHISRYTNYYCWHIVTIVLFSMSVLFFIPSLYPDAMDLAWLSTIYAIAFVVWSLVMILTRKLKFKQFPQWVLILPTAVLGLIGLMT